MGKPILLGVDGEARALVESYSAGLFFESEDEEDFLIKCKELKSDKVLYNKFQEGCLKLALDYDRSKLQKG